MSKFFQSMLKKNEKVSNKLEYVEIITHSNTKQFVEIDEQKGLDGKITIATTLLPPTVNKVVSPFYVAEASSQKKNSSNIEKTVPSPPQIQETQKIAVERHKRIHAAAGRIRCQYDMDFAWMTKEELENDLKKIREAATLSQTL